MNLVDKGVLVNYSKTVILKGRRPGLLSLGDKEFQMTAAEPGYSYQTSLSSLIQVPIGQRMDEDYSNIGLTVENKESSTEGHVQLTRVIISLAREV